MAVDLAGQVRAPRAVVQQHLRERGRCRDEVTEATEDDQPAVVIPRHGDKTADVDVVDHPAPSGHDEAVVVRTNGVG